MPCRFIRCRPYEAICTICKGDNPGLGKEEDVVYVSFYGSAIVGVVEWWFQSEQSPSPQDMARRVGALLERNL
ncbi:TetR-like C-terminal domain-containing protein [Paenibacillus wenxiniae]|uniref:TetR-like C-terminal domain-containing protein n=1 Tax=Paenibacillus wenxiniae TaxID=1636843 RepID=A0ABW4RCC9_9BACL